MKHVFKRLSFILIGFIVIGFLAYSVSINWLYHYFTEMLVKNEMLHASQTIHRTIKLLDFLEYESLAKTFESGVLIDKSLSPYLTLSLEGEILEGDRVIVSDNVYQTIKEKVLQMTSFDQTKSLGYTVDDKTKAIYANIAYKSNNIIQVYRLKLTDESLVSAIEVSYFDLLNELDTQKPIERIDKTLQFYVYEDLPDTVKESDNKLVSKEINIIENGKYLTAYYVSELDESQWLDKTYILLKETFDIRVIRLTFLIQIFGMIGTTLILLIVFGWFFYQKLYREQVSRMTSLESQIDNMLDSNYNDSIIFEGSDILARIARNIESVRKDIISREQFIAEMAYYDTVTGVGNIYLLEERLNTIFEKIESGEHYALVLFEIKNINEHFEAYGSGKMNQLYSTLVALMQSEYGNESVFRKSDYAFAAIAKYNQKPDASHVDSLLQKVKALSLEPPVIPKVYVIAIPDYGMDSKTVLQNLEIALQLEIPKEVVVYSDTLKDAYLEKIEIENSLKEAVIRNEIKVVYQPVVNPDTYKIRGVEALVRWQQSDGRYISPEIFIPLAEQNGIISDIDRLVFEKSMAMLVLWGEIYSESFFVSINSSPIWFDDERFIPFVKEMLEVYDVDPSQICLEIIESSVIENLDNANAVITELHRMGVKIALDDFGKGFSSLNYLRKLKIDKLKIDKDFLQEMNFEQNEYNMIDSIVDMAHSLHLEVVIEGVEEAIQHEYLKNLKVDYIQGYYFSKPISKHDISEILLGSGKIEP